VLVLVEPLSEDVRTDGRQTGAKVGEALEAEEQLAHDQQRPSLTDKSKPMRSGASISGI
jgi:hypothetical protein